MRILRTDTHPNIKTFEGKSSFHRKATRAIALRGEMILMLYTERYDDYSLPGGGVNIDEDIVTGFKRELIEETGAMNIINIKEFGIYEEYRPWYKSDFDIIHMTSYCYTCEVDENLGNSRLEHYEISNGMKPLWINIHEAIAHNEQTMASSDKQGMSIKRETFLLMLIRSELVDSFSY